MRSLRIRLCVIAALGLVVASPVVQALPLGTAFTYQGRLADDGSPAEGLYNFAFSLWDDPLAGNQIGPLLLFESGMGNGPINVTDGLFTVEIDFGAAAFSGQARWLEITVNGMLLSPRQRVSPAPFALALPGLYTLETATTPNVIGGFDGNEVTAEAVGATIGGGGAASFSNRVADDFGTVGGGENNQAGDNMGNTLGATHATASGGYGNTASGYVSTVDGGILNTASGQGSAIGGGQNNAANNSYSTIGGGAGNMANGVQSTVGGGAGNTAGGDVSAVAGGVNNTANGYSSTIAGGDGNTINHHYSTIGGGNFNVANGLGSTVPGGINNMAGGSTSFAAGNRAEAIHHGCFVWGDSTNADFTSTGVNQFLIRANGGVGIGTAAPTTALCVDPNGAGGIIVGGPNISAGGRTSLDIGVSDVSDGYAYLRSIRSAGSSWGDLILNPSGGNVGIRRTEPAHPLHVGTDGSNGNGAHVTAGGTWTNGSSRLWKRNFREIDRREVLRRLAALPITQWQYEGEEESVRHIGPVAEDFAAAFELGHDERYITTVDADGVALAAIQGLHEVVEQQAAQLAEQAALATRQSAQIAELEARLAQLVGLLSAKGETNGSGGS